MRIGTRSRGVGAGLALGAGLGALCAAPSLERVEALFHPWLAEQVAMSPDGQYVAYTRQQGTNLTIEILDLGRMSRKARIVASGGLRGGRAKSR